jgi:Putative MetA-pathway of phenol degradation
MSAKIARLVLISAGIAWSGATVVRAQAPAADVPAPPPGATVAPSGRESPISEILEPRRESEREGGREEIETDRDSFTPSPRTVGRGWIVTESAYSFIENRHAKETHSAPELLFRYGLLERIELRLGFNYEAGGAPSAVSGGEGGAFLEGGGVEHETNISYGLKIAMTRQDRWFPDSIVLLQGFTPTSGPDPATQYVVTYGWGWELSNRWKLDAAMRYSEDSEHGDRFNIWAPSIVLKAPFREKWAAHIEYFGEMSQNRAEEFSKQFISPGVHYLVTPNFEVGVRVGWGLNDQSARFFSNAGVGWRF